MRSALEKALALAFVAAVASISACSSADPTSTGSGGTGSDAGANEVVVTVKSNAFDPPSVTVPVGGTVKWVWASGVHNVVSGTNCAPDGAFSSGDPISGATFSQAFTQAGTFDYFCETHCAMGMVGKVIVE